MRKIIDHFFDRKVEELKATLERETLAFHIRYEKLHAERAEVIKNIYGQLIDLSRSFQVFVKPVRDFNEPTSNEMERFAFKAYNKLSLFHDRNKIFLEKQIAEKIDDLLNSFVDAGWKFQESQELKAEGKSGVAERIAAWKIISGKIPAIREEIETEFRKIIGVQEI